MSVEWLIAGCIFIVLATVIGGWMMARAGEADLGAVSEQWLSEHRLSQSAVDHR
jgi:hypothetical protein